MQSTAIDTVLRRNNARRSTDDGFDIRARATTLRRNHAVNNADLGINAVGGVADAGGNIGRRNGDPAQCRNVFCG